MDDFFKTGAQQVSTPDNLNSELPPVQNFAFGGIANPGQRAVLRGSDRSYLDARQAELDKYEQERLAYNDALTKWQTEVYNPYKAQVEAYNTAADKYNTEVYNPYKSQVDQYNQALEKYNTEVYNPYKTQYDAYEKAVNAWNAGDRTSDYAGPAAPTLAKTFDMTAPTAPKAFEMAAPTAPKDFAGVAPTLPFKEEEVKAYQQQAAGRARQDASNRAVAIDVVSNPEQFNFGSMSIANRFMAHGGEVMDDSHDKTARSIIKDFEGYGYTPEEMMELADEVAAKGRGGDELLAYLSPESVEFLKAHGGSGTINPITGLPEFKGGIIGKLVNAVRNVFRPQQAAAAAAPAAAAAQAAAPAQAEAPKAPTAAELMEQLKAANDAKAALQTKYDTDMASFKTQAQKDQEAAIAAALKADAEKRAATIATPVMGQRPVSGETMTAANMLKTLGGEQAKTPTQQEIALAMQRNTAPPPPSGSVVPPSSQYGVPTSSDGKWLYSDGKWQPNQQVSIDPIERASGPAGAISQPGIGATSPITVKGPTAATQISAGPGFSAIDSSYLKNLTSMDPRWFTKKGEEQTTQQPRTTAQGPNVSSTFEGQLPYVANTPSYTDRGVGSVGSIGAIPIGGISTPGMPSFGQQRQAAQATNPSNYFGMSQQGQQGISPGTVALGSPDMPLYGAMPTMNALGSNKNLAPGMLGGQQSAGMMTDRLGNRIYSPGMAPLFGYAGGGQVSIKDILAQNAETLSDEQPEEAINTNPVGTAQQYLSDLSGTQERTDYALSPNRIAVKRTRSSQSPGGTAKEMAMQYESLTKDDLGAMKDMKPKARDTDSARAQLEEMARQYKLKLRAVENKAKGLATDTFGVPTLETPTLMKNSLAKKRFEKGGEAKKAQAGEGEPSLFGVSDYATRASERMFPDQMGQDDQRDAARHMLASAMVARKTTPGVAEFLGKAHERLSNPESFFNMFGIGQPRDDYAMDVHNNRIGAELAARSKSQQELEALVRQMALQSQNQQTPGKPWTMSREQMEARKNKGMTPPPQYNKGGMVEDIGKWLKDNDINPSDFLAALGRTGSAASVALTPSELNKGESEELARRRRMPATVDRADGSPEEGETGPAFVTPKSGKGRKEGPISQALKSGDAYVNMAKGVTELPYDLVGAPVDLATMVMRPFGYNTDKPVMGSDWIKEKMTGAGVRPEPPSDPTAKGFYTAGELLSNLTNPAGVTRAGVKGAQKAGQAASDVAKDFQQYNRQLTVPGASYAVRPVGSTMLTGKVGFEDDASGVDQLMRQGLSGVQFVVGQNKDQAKILSDFWDKKARNYFTRQFGTPDDPIADAIAKKKIRGSVLDEVFPEYLLDQLSVGKTRVNDQGQTRFFPKYPRAMEDFTQRYDASTGIKGNLVTTQPGMGHPEYAHSLSSAANDLQNIAKTAEEDKLLRQGIRPELINTNVGVVARSTKDPSRVIGGSTTSADKLLKAYEEAQAYEKMDLGQQTAWADKQFGEGRKLHGMLPEDVAPGILSQNVKTAIDKGEPVYEIAHMASPLSKIFDPSKINQYLASLPPREAANIRFEDAVRGAVKLTEESNQLNYLVSRIKAGKPVADSVFSQGVSSPLVQIKDGPLEGFAWKRIEDRKATVPEGAYVGHSVGGYEVGGPTYDTTKREGFNSGLWQVYTLRDNRNRPVTTVEVKMLDENTPVVTQIKGNGRATGNVPAEKYDTAVMQFLQDYLKPAAIQEKDELLTPLLQSYKSALDSLPGTR